MAMNIDERSGGLAEYPSRSPFPEPESDTSRPTVRLVARERHTPCLELSATEHHSPRRAKTEAPRPLLK
jgi:hypothetical protein